LSFFFVCTAYHLNIFVTGAQEQLFKESSTDTERLKLICISNYEANPRPAGVAATASVVTQHKIDIS
jgi:hypothetical protein